jgi:hypothetical protein
MGGSLCFMESAWEVLCVSWSQHGRFFVFHGGFWDESCVLLLVFCSWCMLMVGSAEQVAADSRLVQLCGCRPVFTHNPASMLLVSMWAAQHGICSLTRP